VLDQFLLHAKRACTALISALAVILVVSAFGSPASAGDLMRGYEAIQRGDYATAHQELTPLARAGDANAMIQLAHLYAEGLGVPANEAQATALYKAALLRIAAERAQAAPRQ